MRIIDGPCAPFWSLSSASLPKFNILCRLLHHQVPKHVPAYAGQYVVVHRCDCRVQATKGCKALYLSGNAFKIAVVVLPEPYCQVVFFQLQMQTHLLHLLWCPPCPAHAHWLWQRSELQLVYFAMQLHKNAPYMRIFAHQAVKIDLAHFTKSSLELQPASARPIITLPWLRYASPPSSCASTELGSPQSVKHRSIAHLFFESAL